MQNYEPLKKVLVDNVSQALKDNGLNLRVLLPQMEENFVRLGFRRQPEDKTGVENILIIRLDNIGDFLLTVPAIREIRMNYPNAFITLAVRSHVRPIAELCPYVNEVLPFEYVLKSSNLIEFVMYASNFSSRYLWRRHYDLGFAFRYWGDAWHLMSMLLLYFSGANQRVAYLIDAIKQYKDEMLPKNRNMSYVFLTHPILNPKEIMHDCARSLYLIKAVGLKIRQTDLEFWYTRGDFYQAKSLLEDFSPNRVKVAVGLGATHLARRYPIEKYLVALKKIVEKGVSLVLLGGPTEIEDAQFLEDNLPKEFVKNLVPVQTGWIVDAAIISQTDMYLGNDTGTQHIAAALKKPVIVLSRVAEDRKEIFPDEPTELDIYYPWQTPSIIVQPKHQMGDCATTPHYSGCDVKAPHCITQINPKNIVAAFDEMYALIKTSNIKKTSCPPIIKGADQVSPLKSGFEFDKI